MEQQLPEKQPHRKFFVTRWATLIITLSAGIYIGHHTNRTMVVSINESRELGKLELVFQQIQEHYVDTINMSALIEHTIPVMLEELDPHSAYIPAESMSQANEHIEGNFDGIGVTFNMSNDTVVVMNVIAGGPSERNGITPGDRIVTVNDSIIAGKKISQNNIVKMLRGTRGTRVNLGISRSDEEKLVTVTVIRDKIPVKSVDASFMIDKSTGYIKLSKFSKTTHEEFKVAAATLQKQGMKNLALDLRGNGGGLLDQSFKIANEFLKKGNLIVYTEGRNRNRYDYIATGEGSYCGINLVMLIDENSASASEIVAGAIQDNDRGVIVGRRSFGKGLVQEPILFSDNSGLRLTVARYYTPTGRSIQKPYTNNRQEYENEVYERYENGEMFKHLDNTQTYADSSHTVKQQFLTPKGKIVYGGGGIMPDIFVPIDTIGFNEFYKSVYRKNLIYRYALQFTDQRRSQLNAIKNFEQLYTYFSNYQFDSIFRRYAADNGVVSNDDAWNECSNIIDTQLRAFIGRNTPLEDNAYFAIISKIDNTLDTAVKLFLN